MCLYCIIKFFVFYLYIIIVINFFCNVLDKQGHNKTFKCVIFFMFTIFINKKP